MQRTGEYLRFVSDLDRRVFEFTVLVVARHRDQAFEWAHHVPIALDAGMPPEVIEAVAEGDKSAIGEPFAQVQTFATGLLEHEEIPDSLVSELIAMCGHAGVMDLVATVGYYSTLAMVMEVAGTRAPAAGPFLP
jgi:4-carboxymuconolactone decarboxylase